MGGFMDILPGIAGAISGALAPSPYVPKMPWGDDPNAFLLPGKEMISGLQGNLAWLNRMREGKQPLMSRADVATMLSPERARLAALQRTMLRQGMEREIASGRGPRGTSMQAYAGSLNQDVLNAQRQLGGQVYSQLSQMRPQMQMEAANQAARILMGQQGLAGEAWNLRQQGLGAKAQHGSGLRGGLYRAAGGFAAGMGGA